MILTHRKIHFDVDFFEVIQDAVIRAEISWPTFKPAASKLSSIPGSRSSTVDIDGKDFVTGSVGIEKRENSVALRNTSSVEAFESARSSTAERLAQPVPDPLISDQLHSEPPGLTIEEPTPTKIEPSSVIKSHPMGILQFKVDTGCVSNEGVFYVEMVKDAEIFACTKSSEKGLLPEWHERFDKFCTDLDTAKLSIHVRMQEGSSQANSDTTVGLWDGLISEVLGKANHRIPIRHLPDSKNVLTGSVRVSLAYSPVMVTVELSNKVD